MSESTYYSLLAARTRMFNKYGVGEVNKYIEKSEINGRLVCYCSDQAHSSVEKSALVAITRIHILPSDDKLSLRGETLRKAIEKDKKEGLIPFFVCATLGTTGACAFDNLEEIGPICKQEDIWLHIDAAYAGSAFLCPEYRKFLKGIEYASSFVFNPSKWLMTNFDCTCLWVESSIHLHQTFTVAPLYLKHKYSGDAIDYMHWQVGLSRRFRALKLWFVLRSFGIEGLQEHIRKGAKLGELFESLVLKDDRFEILAERHLGLVVFRLKGENEITEQLLKQLNKDGRIHLVPAKVKNNYIIRFTVTSYYTTEDDIKRDWRIIQSTSSAILTKLHNEKMHEEHLKKFQSSLMLSNVPQTPKIVNASFLAFFPDSDFVLTVESARQLTNVDYSQTHLPLTPRRKPRFLTNLGQKMFSLDEFSQTYPNSNRKTNFLALNNINGGKENGSSTDSDDASPNNETNNNGNNSNNNNNGQQIENISINPNTNSNTNGVRKNSKFNKQTSLDSKIEHIFEEAVNTNNIVNNTNNIDNTDLN